MSRLNCALCCPIYSLFGTVAQNRNVFGQLDWIQNKKGQNQSCPQNVYHGTKMAPKKKKTAILFNYGIYSATNQKVTIIEFLSGQCDRAPEIRHLDQTSSKTPTCQTLFVWFCIKTFIVLQSFPVSLKS
jgi:hypothetical protein